MDGLDMNLLLEKMNNPNFANEFNQIMNEIQSIPGINEKMGMISQMQDERQQIMAMQQIPGLAEKVAKLQNLMSRY